MPREIEKAVTCPKCGQQSNTKFIESVNTIDDKNIKKNIFDESIFRWKCKKCGFTTKCQHPFLYNDIENKFMVYFIPNVERAKLSDPKLDAEYKDIINIKKRVVPSLNSMKEKIYLFENHINDMAVELVKLAVAQIVAQDTGHYVYEGYLTDISESENTISFQFFVGSDRRSYIQTTRYELYSQSMDIVNLYFASADFHSAFLNIDKNWAKTTLEKYKSS